MAVNLDREQEEWERARLKDRTEEHLAGLAIQILARGGWSPPIGGDKGPMGGLARDSRQDKRAPKNWFKPLIISYFLVYQHNNVINCSSNQLDMFLLIKIKS